MYCLYPLHPNRMFAICWLSFRSSDQIGSRKDSLTKGLCQAEFKAPGESNVPVARGKFHRRAGCHERHPSKPCSVWICLNDSKIQLSSVRCTVINCRQSGSAGSPRLGNSSGPSIFKLCFQTFSASAFKACPEPLTLKYQHHHHQIAHHLRWQNAQTPHT